MWNAPKNTIPQDQITRHDLDVLERAAYACIEFDQRTDAVYTALTRLQARSLRASGFRLYREGLAEDNPLKRFKMLKEACELINKHLNL